jgi:hypothetical protein
MALPEFTGSIAPGGNVDVGDFAKYDPASIHRAIQFANGMDPGSRGSSGYRNRADFLAAQARQAANQTPLAYQFGPGGSVQYGDSTYDASPGSNANSAWNNTPMSDPSWGMNQQSNAGIWSNLSTNNPATTTPNTTPTTPVTSMPNSPALPTMYDPNNAGWRNGALSLASSGVQQSSTSNAQAPAGTAVQQAQNAAPPPNALDTSGSQTGLHLAQGDSGSRRQIQPYSYTNPEIQPMRTSGLPAYYSRKRIA